MDFAIFVPHLLIDPPLVVRIRHPSRHFTPGMECLNCSTVPIPVLVVHFGHSLKPPNECYRVRVIRTALFCEGEAGMTESVRGALLLRPELQILQSTSSI